MYDKEEILMVVSFMCLNHSYFHARLELSQAYKSMTETCIIPPAYPD